MISNVPCFFLNYGELRVNVVICYQTLPANQTSKVWENNNNWKTKIIGQTAGN